MPLGQAVLTGVNPMSPGRIALFIIGMIAIIAAAYFVTYFLGSKTFKLRSGRSIILRDRFAVSKDKSFYVMEAYGKVYIIGVTNHSMTVVDTLDAEAAAVYQEAQNQSSPEGRPGSPHGVRSRMVNSMAEFIAAHILKRGDDSRGVRGDFDSVYRRTMSDRDSEPREDTEDEE